VKEHELPTADEMIRRAVDDLDKAYRALGDASDWLRSDWRPLGSALTDRQFAARTALQKGIQDAAAVINRAKREADQ
jgi:hypothetical protein